MYKCILWWCLTVAASIVVAENNNYGGINLNRTFPPGTIYASISKIDYPQVTLQEIPSNWGSSLLGLMLLSTQELTMSPASIIRDKDNTTHVQNYLDTLKNQPVAVQLDYHGKVWVIWQLTTSEVNWVIENKFNTWQKTAS